MQQPQDRRQAYPFDEVDLGLMLMTAIVPPHWPWAILLGIQTVVRRSPKAVSRILDTLGWEADASAAQWLLPGAAKLLNAPEETASTEGPADTAGPSLDALETLEDVEQPPAPEQSMSTVLAKLPRRVDLLRLRFPSSTTSIPLGVDHNQQPMWVDLASEVYHLGLYGQTGAGKDNLLRCWFVLLTRRNAPETLQFCFLDGKGDWLVPQLAGLSHMFIEPAGGYGRKGDEAILAAVKAIDAEAERRQNAIRQAGCISRDQYVRKTGQPMPLLVVVATDVMTSVAGEVEELLTNLVSKARSLGIRVLVSMQSPTGRDTRWRGNLSTVMSGNLQLASQDEPAMGLPAKSLRFRPSQLPPAQQRPGVFVARVGGEQVLVQAPYLAEEDFERQWEKLPRQAKYVNQVDGDDGATFCVLEPSDTRFIGIQNEQNRTEQAEQAEQGDDDSLLAALLDNYQPDRDTLIRSFLKAGMPQRMIAETLRRNGISVDTNKIAQMAKKLRQ